MCQSFAPGNGRQSQLNFLKFMRFIVFYNTHDEMHELLCGDSCWAAISDPVHMHVSWRPRSVTACPNVSTFQRSMSMQKDRSVHDPQFKSHAQTRGCVSPSAETAHWKRSSQLRQHPGQDSLPAVCTGQELLQLPTRQSMHSTAVFPTHALPKCHVTAAWLYSPASGRSAERSHILHRGLPLQIQALRLHHQACTDICPLLIT